MDFHHQYSLSALRTTFLSLCPRAPETALSPSVIPLPTANCSLKGRVPMITPSLFLPSSSMCCFFPIVVQKLLKQPQLFFRGNYFIWRCVVCVSVGGGEFRVFLCCHLGPASHIISFNSILCKTNKYISVCEFSTRIGTGQRFQLSE